jgi:alpha-L-arabinofuranosidase
MKARWYPSRPIRWLALAQALVLLAGSAAHSGAGQSPTTTIRVDVSKRLNRISPLLYGHFAEFMFENIKSGLWAELLRNRAFEDMAPRPSVAHYWERYPDNRNDDYSLIFGGARFGLAEAGYPKAFHNRAQIMICTSEDHQPRGMYQGEIPVRQGVTYRGSIWLKGAALQADRRAIATEKAFEGQIRVTLEENTTDGRTYAASVLSSIAPDWSRHEFDMPVGVTDPQARFSIQILGVGAVWIDQVSLMPSDAKAGVRADVMEKIMALRPAFVRWPGGNVAQDYHWEWGIGSRDERPTWVNMSWADDPEPADFGTPEYLAFCRAIGAEPAIVVNVEGRGATLSEAAELRLAGKDIRKESRAATAQEAANWVEYCNGPITSKYGSLRARDGHREPYHLKYWEIGNEIWGDWVRGHSDAVTYATNARRYIRAMKAVDPGIQIIAVGHNDMGWNREVLRAIGREIDILSIHHYQGAGEDAGERFNLMARPLWFESFYDRVQKLIEKVVPDRKIMLGINEWNTTLPGPRQHSMESAIYGARLMNVFERKGDLVSMSAVSDLVNGWPGGIIQASRHRVFTTPTYAVIQAYNIHRGAWRLSSSVQTPVTYQPAHPELGKDIPALDVVASTTEDGDQIILKVVNTSFSEDIRAELKLEYPTGSLAREASVTTINGPDLEASNSFATPDRVRAQSSSFAGAGPQFAYTFEKHSVTVMLLSVAR